MVAPNICLKRQEEKSPIWKFMHQQWLGQIMANSSTTKLDEIIGKCYQNVPKKLDFKLPRLLIKPVYLIEVVPDYNKTYFKILCFII